LSEGYGMTETWPCTASLCPDGHLHFEPTQGLLEVQSLETEAPAHPGEPGTLVLTPLPPYRDTTLVLCYNTEDVVRTVTAPLTCRLRHLPAVSPLLGKLRLAVRHADGWTFPRDVLEALEAVEEVPLPARCGFWAVPGGVAVDVVARGDLGVARRKIERRLDDRGVSLRELHLLDPADRGLVHNPLPWRGDLRELTFSASPDAACTRSAVLEG